MFEIVKEESPRYTNPRDNDIITLKQGSKSNPKERQKAFSPLKIRPPIPDGGLPRPLYLESRTSRCFDRPGYNPHGDNIQVTITYVVCVEEYLVSAKPSGMGPGVSDI
ncbi:hypothetical protein EVAR_73868_1 [Eumeta japonica]|uniref:Uncharacterized protein n=1 Tax=Eumeta variegata TaxID=151549 RepID=A0A4C1T6Z0_EUMVA|nr:hypothetical protein EVAR_73868_1 [Eumeta japonica]